MTGLSERDQIMTLLNQAIAAGACQDRACAAISLRNHRFIRLF